jgi:hypothetical protein
LTTEGAVSKSGGLSPWQKWEQIIRGKGLQEKQARWAYAFLSLSLLGLFVFSILPIIAAFGLGFVDWTLLSPPKWAGVSNFQRLLVRQSTGPPTTA